MEKYIENLIKGHFEYDIEKIEVSERKIEADVSPGCDRDGSFVISCSDSRSIRLSVMTSDPRIRVSVNEYEGPLNEGLEVLYSVSTKGLDSGFVFKRLLGFKENGTVAAAFCKHGKAHVSADGEL